MTEISWGIFVHFVLVSMTSLENLQVFGENQEDTLEEGTMEETETSKRPKWLEGEKAEQVLLLDCFVHLHLHLHMLLQRQQRLTLLPGAFDPHEM